MTEPREPTQEQHERKRYWAQGTETGVCFWLMDGDAAIALVDQTNREMLNVIVDALNTDAALRQRLEQANALMLEGAMRINELRAQLATVARERDEAREAINL